MANEEITSEIDIRREPGQGTRRQVNTEDTGKKIVATDGGEDDIEIDIVDDTPEQDRNRPPRNQNTRTAIPEDDEIGQYTKGVQERLKQMKYEYHEERRQKEAWQREHGAAVDITAKALEENRRLRRMLEEGHKTMLASNKGAAESELQALRASLQAAHEAGESAKIAELQEKISRAAARAVSIEQTQPIKFQEEQAQDQSNSAQSRPQGDNSTQRVELSSKMRNWMMRNPWFNGNDPGDGKMTSYAFGLHDELIRSGEQAESDSYFKKIDNEMRQVFPDRFKNPDAGENNRSTSQRRTVSAASRTDMGDRGGERQTPSRVELTTSEQRLARRLGISDKDYAREKIRLMQQEN